MLLSVGYAGVALLAWFIANPAAAQPQAAPSRLLGANRQLTIHGEPTVRVTRQGRVLTLDYQLLDADGRNRVVQNRTNPPRFTVCQDGREIGSGVFEYG